MNTLITITHGSRHTGHGSPSSGGPHLAHTHWWPHGPMTCVFGASRQITQSSASRAALLLVHMPASALQLRPATPLSARRGHLPGRLPSESQVRSPPATCPSTPSKLPGPGTGISIVSAGSLLVPAACAVLALRVAPRPAHVVWHLHCAHQRLNRAHQPPCLCEDTMVIHSETDAW